MRYQQKGTCSKAAVRPSATCASLRREQAGEKLERMCRKGSRAPVWHAGEV